MTGKRVELGNGCCRDLGHLHQELIRARERLRHKQESIRSCSRQCGYSPSFFGTRSVRTVNPNMCGREGQMYVE